MSELLKNKIIILLFLMIYFNIVFVPFSGYYGSLSIILCFIYVLYELMHIKVLYISIFIKIIIFFIFLFFYFFIEQLIINIVLYGMDGVGYLQRNGFVDYNHSWTDFSWQEKLYWAFIASLHYPIYIYIFIKPFVNHLSKSIDKIKMDENEY